MKENGKCTFCEDLNHIDERSSDIQKQGIRKDYSIALVNRCYRGKNICSQISHYGYKLRYCPECGRKIEMKNGVVCL